MAGLAGTVSQVSIPAGSTANPTNGPISLDNGHSKAFHTMMVTVSSGVSAGVVTLQLSHDNQNWFSVASPPALSASTVVSQTVNGVAQFARASITTGITGGTVAATIASA